jgi:hypothetical protein
LDEYAYCDINACVTGMDAGRLDDLAVLDGTRHIAAERITIRPPLRF